ncbi:radical SAM protein, partial [bacterium]|nr:radical SAM protein [bacterium]
SEKFCPHFHLSLQSACNNTLKRMNRFYTVEFYLEQIEDITKRFKNPFLGSDIIAGFVGETDKDFQVTVENLEKSKLSQIHTFPYSIRKGTLAEKMEGHVPESTKNERADIIKEISIKKFKTFLDSNIGSETEVLIEKRLDKKTGMFKGLTRNYINVLLPEGSFNELVKVKLNNIQDNKFFGELIR